MISAKKRGIKAILPRYHRYRRRRANNNRWRCYYRSRSTDNQRRRPRYYNTRRRYGNRVVIHRNERTMMLQRADALTTKLNLQLLILSNGAPFKGFC
jgi:hypothetical protein